MKPTAALTQVLHIGIPWVGLQVVVLQGGMVAFPPPPP